MTTLFVLAKDGVQVVSLYRPVQVVGKRRLDGVARLPEGEELAAQELVGLVDGVDVPVTKHLDHLIM